MFLSISLSEVSLFFSPHHHSNTSQLSHSQSEPKKRDGNKRNRVYKTLYSTTRQDLHTRRKKIRWWRVGHFKTWPLPQPNPTPKPVYKEHSPPPVSSTGHKRRHDIAEYWPDDFPPFPPSSSLGKEATAVSTARCNVPDEEPPEATAREAHRWVPPYPLCPPDSRCSQEERGPRRSPPPPP